MSSRTRPSIGRAAVALTLGTALGLLSACGGVATGSAWLDQEEVKPDPGRVIVTHAVEAQPLAKNISPFALMALFAKVVYRHDLPEAVRRKEGCAYMDAAGEPPSFGMPRKADGSGWKRWKGAKEACYNEHGLYYETYVHETVGGVIDEAVIAIRGTENWNKYDLMHDWGTNVSAAVGIEPAEYARARELTPILVEKLAAAGPKVLIHATGHSLGGGIAQQTAYLSRKLVAAFAFDTSPVTNWSRLVRLDKEPRTAGQKPVMENADPTIYRVYHWHEGLAYVRNVTSRFNSRRFGRSDYEFFFQKVPPVAAHEMGILACHMAARIEGAEANHHYPRDFARRILEGAGSKEHAICPDGVVDLPPN